MASLKDKRAYLDYNATAPLRPEARDAVLAALEAEGNPSSIHAEGRAARALVEDARRAVAALVGASPRGVVFTSGGTEALALTLHPSLCAPGLAPPARLLLSAGEHVAALSGHRFPPDAVTLVGLRPDGRIDLEALDAELARDARPALLALQSANNETGVLQPVAEAAARVHAQGGLVVCDCAQHAGRLPLDGRTLGADALILSAHKFGGPKGAGAWIAMREGLVIAPLLKGGGQERGRRAGTENVAAIAGFGAAAQAIGDAGAEARRLAELRDELERRLLAVAPDAVIFGATAPRLPNTSGFAVPGLSAATLLMRLDLAGIAASSGSACSSGKVARSHVLAAMGVEPGLASGALRLSLGWGSGEPDIERFAFAFAREVGALRRKTG